MADVEIAQFSQGVGKLRQSLLARMLYSHLRTVISKSSATKFTLESDISALRKENKQKSNI